MTKTDKMMTLTRRQLYAYAPWLKENKPHVIAVLDSHSVDEKSEKTWKKHDSGWSIRGVVSEDHYTWVERFEAEHPLLGRVCADLSKDQVKASSIEATNAFFSAHPLEEFDHWDI